MSSNDDFDEGEERQLSLREWEREEKARTYHESGYPPAEKCRLQKSLGNGFYGQLVTAIDDIDPNEDCEPGMYHHKGISPIAHEGSRYISAKQFKNAYSAVAFANSRGFVMNVHLSITWGMMGISDPEIAAQLLTKHFIKDLKQWSDDRIGEKDVPYFYAHEVGAKHGFHTHILISLKKELLPEFREWTMRRLCRICGKPSLPKETFKALIRHKKALKVQWRWWFQYLVKGVHPDETLASTSGLTPLVPVHRLIHFMHKDPGKHQCIKNIGVARCIDSAARKAARFRSLLDSRITDVRLLYSGAEFLAYLRSQNILDEQPDKEYLLEQEAQVLAVCAEQQQLQPQMSASGNKQRINMQITHKSKVSALAALTQKKQMESDMEKTTALLRLLAHID